MEFAKSDISVLNVGIQAFVCSEWWKRWTKRLIAVSYDIQDQRHTAFYAFLVYSDQLCFVIFV
jgi:hypothetical protein